ncbi:aminotransferase class I/II-fold pyridoxal phosphate-dependent enzyme [Candidatus Pelagibacter sp.]|nr:aminotransferase class I/II-fold pyridoxal phosphate-dependent enzyme [Candidatus Pelagibacter sp.]
MIPLSEPTIVGNEIKFIKTTIKKNWISTFGNYNKKFEKSISKITKSKNVISVSSGTAALHLALKALGVDKKSEVIVPSLTFVASINVIKYLNANPIFMDVGLDHNLSISKTIEFLNKKTFYKNKFTYNKKSKKKITAIIIVHMWGNALDFFELKKICKKKNIYIIEDAAEALGTYYLKGKFKNMHVGISGDIGCLSFNGNKIITTGAGGALLTKNNLLAKKILYFAEQAKDDPIRFIHNDIGYNYRLANLNAAFGCGQITKLKYYLSKRKKNYLFYSSFINKIPGLKILTPQSYSSSNHWMNILIIDKNLIKKSPYYFHKKLLLKGIQTRLVWKPNHLQKMYKDNEKYKISLSEKIFDSCLCIPSSSNLNISKLKKICRSIKEIAIN